MKKFFLYAPIAFILFIVIAGVIAPKEATVQRSKVINKPVSKVFPFFLSLQNMEQYSPWQALDPDVVHEYRGTGNTVGSVHRWVSDHKEVGVGEQEIKEIVPNQKIVSELRFEEPFQSVSKGFLEFEPTNTSTKVTWGYKGEFGFVESIFMMFMDMEKVLGDDFDKGLNKAKAILEQ